MMVFVYMWRDRENQRLEQEDVSLLISAENRHMLQAKLYSLNENTEFFLEDVISIDALIRVNVKG